MENEIKNFVYDAFEIEIDSKYQFKELYGLTFVFKNDVTLVKNIPISNFITPVGIIYKENDEYYIAPLDKRVSLSDVVREYVKECLR